MGRRKNTSKQQKKKECVKMQKLFIIGNLVRDPELRVTPSGIQVAGFTIAINGKKKEDPAMFVRVTAWRGLAETCAKYLTKGKKVFVSGPVSVTTYTAKDGTTRASMEITADDVEFLSPAGTGMENAQVDERAGFVKVDDETLPF
jgi:single-strand DNA-binding protein